MTRVPTWTELRIDASRLAQLQADCHNRVHTVLEKAIPELDRKLAMLKARGGDGKHELSNKREPIRGTEQDLNELEHLKPLPMPLSHYLKLNRPELVEAADRRTVYLKSKAERRKQISSSRNLTTLGAIRSSSRASSNKGTSSLRSSLRSSTRTVSRDNVAPNYQVKYELSEHEMKRLTAKVYNRLPEVKRQRNEEVTKHMKVQNYKNKMEYGRKLLLNRRQGVINYPLRTTCEDSSIDSGRYEM